MRDPCDDDDFPYYSEQCATCKFGEYRGGCFNEDPRMTDDDFDRASKGPCAFHTPGDPEPHSRPEDESDQVVIASLRNENTKLRMELDSLRRENATLKRVCPPQCLPDPIPAFEPYGERSLTIEERVDLSVTPQTIRERYMRLAQQEAEARLHSARMELQVLEYQEMISRMSARLEALGTPVVSALSSAG